MRPIAFHWFASCFKSASVAFRHWQRPLRSLAICFAARHESVVHLADILFRRTDLCLLGDPGDAVLNDCADLAAKVLGWSEVHRLTELKSVRSELVRSIPAATNE